MHAFRSGQTFFLLARRDGSLNPTMCYSIIVSASGVLEKESGKMSNYVTPAYPSPHKSSPGRGRRIAIWILSILTGVFFLTSLFLFAAVVFILLGTAGAEYAPDKAFKERVLMGSGHDKVLLLQVSGPIMDYESIGMFGATRDTVESVRKQLERAAEDDSVKAVLLEVNSPGGGITASDTVHHLIAGFKEETGKPVVAYFADVAASGGYYISVGADTIMAHPSTITGSIGAIIGLMNFEGLFEKIGLKDITIKSARLKDMGSPTRPMTEEEEEIFKNILSSMHERFVAVVAQGRKNLTIDQVRKLADGRVYTGEQAKELGLVDSLGYREDGFEAAKQLAGITEARLVRYERVLSFLRMLSGYSEASRDFSVNFNLPESENMVLPMYLWRPDW
jgi:protease-4